MAKKSPRLIFRVPNTASRPDLESAGVSRLFNGLNELRGHVAVSWVWGRGPRIAPACFVLDLQVGRAPIFHEIAYSGRVCVLDGLRTASHNLRRCTGIPHNLRATRSETIRGGVAPLVAAGRPRTAKNRPKPASGGVILGLPGSCAAAACPVQPCPGCAGRPTGLFRHVSGGARTVCQLRGNTLATLSLQENFRFALPGNRKKGSKLGGGIGNRAQRP